MSLGPKNTAALLEHVHIWLPFCMIELASADGTVDCVYPIVVSGSIPGPIL